MRTQNPTKEPHFAWPAVSLITVVGILIATSAVVVLATAPFTTLLGPGAHALTGAMHGLFSFLFLISATIGLYLGWRLLMARIRAFPDIQLVTTVMATLSFITIAFGNWIYIPYRANNPDSPKAYFMQEMPEVHKIFFEFKEFTALFTLPLSIAAAFICWRYGSQILESKWLRVTISILIALTFFYLIIAFGLGAAVTKLRSV